VARRDASSTPGGPGPRRPSGSIATWPVWSLRGRALTWVLLVETVALAAAALGAVMLPPTEASLLLAGLLAGVAVLHTEIATGLERIRRRVADTTYFDLSSVWTFAAAVLLPPGLATAVIGCVYAHLWFRVWKPARFPLFRHVFTTATVVLAAHAAHLVVAGTGGVAGWPRDLAGLGSLALAVVVYGAVNTTLVTAAIALSSTTRRSTTRLRDLVGHWDDNVLELATLSLGALVAVALSVNPWLVVLALPPLLVLHRAVLVRQLEQVASTDGKTGLLTAAAWHARAAAELRRAKRARGAAAVLILDLDHFKAVNDAHGHLAGDQVLAAVAGAVRAEVREHDLVGRFGGEEFVVLLPDLPAEHAGQAEVSAIAERIRERVSTLEVAVDTPDGPLTIAGLSTSVGGATYPAHGVALAAVMQVADAALYAAKRAGRNTVRISPPPRPPAPRPSPPGADARDP
jgi:diguanylate cyclase (GGDEF)-like protein